MYALALDVGGTKLGGAVVTSAGEIIDRAQVPTIADGTGEELYDSVRALLEGLRVPDGGYQVCGVGSGGPMSAGGVELSPLNIPAWRGFGLRARLEADFGVPTFVDNDAKALALGEGWLGAAVGASDYLAMVVSTGVGGGIVVDGRLLDGATGNGGHIGHVIVEPDGFACVCGASGCLEAETSGTGIARQFGHPAADADDALKRRTGTLVGRAVGSVVNLLDIRLAVVAGSVALGFGEVFFTAAQAELDRVCQIAHARGARIAPGGLGADGPLIGAAAVGFRGLGHDVGVR